MATRYFCDRCGMQQLVKDTMRLVMFPDAEEFWIGAHVVERFELCEICLSAVRREITSMTRVNHA